MIGVTAFGRTAKLEHLALVDKWLDMSKKQSPWEVMDTIVKDWMATRPTEYKSFVADVDEIRDSTYNDYGAAENTHGSGSLRRTLDLPLYVERSFRIIYSGTDFQFDRKFYRQIWKRYPIFRVSKRS